MIIAAAVAAVVPATTGTHCSTPAHCKLSKAQVQDQENPGDGGATSLCVGPLASIILSNIDKAISVAVTVGAKGRENLVG